MSARYERLGPCFFGANLEYGEIDLYQNHTVTCFLIVEHVNDEIFVRKQAMQLRVAHCDLFNIYGNHAKLWHRIIDEMPFISYPYPDREINDMIFIHDDIVDFVHELDICIHARTFIPNDVFLLYDDISLYRDVLRRLEKGGWEYVCF